MNRSYIVPVCLAALLLVAACGSDDSTTAPRGPAAPVKVVARVVEPQRLVDEIQALGTARANESIEIQPRVASIVTRV
ncbi:MAG TPA: hypothetical protein VF389_07970, partial [Woeseiaceae bacterium]